MNIVIPMAGAGSRFSQAGYQLPKPLIAVHGKPMYHWATNSLPLHLASNLLFIIRRDAFTTQLKQDIHQHYAAYQPRIRVLEHITRGQAETVYLGADLLNHGQPTLIHNADTAFLRMELPRADAFGAIVVFEPPLHDARYSFARTAAADDDKIIEVREKKIISRHASTGTYYFADTGWLLHSISQQLLHNRTEQGEFYIAPLYNEAIAQGQYVQRLGCTNFTCLGTPDELAAALPNLLDDLKNQQLVR